MTTNPPNVPISHAELDQQLTRLAAQRQPWVDTPVAERIAILAAIKECLMPVARAWAETAARQKGIAVGSPLEGEEWLSGPYSVLSYCNQLMDTLGKIAGKQHLRGLQPVSVWQWQVVR